LARSPLPSLEALDRAGALALAVGFPLLTLGVITGAMWVHAMHGSALSGSPHEIAALLAWSVYVALALQRFAAHQGAHRCAVSALVGFALLAAAVVGVEWLA
jgi:ABC-type transport system involved in cytochrome c biogenesis permease subunit